MENLCFLLVLMGAFVAVASTSCPCDDANLCHPVSTKYSKEVFVFSLHQQSQNVSWQAYDWSKITTVVPVGYYSPDLVCHAHKHNARVALIANIPTSNLTEASSRTAWVAQQLQTVQRRFMDGLNFDFESEIKQDDLKLREGLALLVQETYITFKKANPNYQVTYDVPWKPNADLRYYDYQLISWYTDFIFVMAYDERSQIHGPCVAGPNSALDHAKYGISEFQKLGIAASKLVLGLPWYGYIYPCLNLDKNGTCSIREVPFRGVNCSDAAGKEINFSFLYNTLLPRAPQGRQWHLASQTPFFSLPDYEGQPHQVWYDDPDSLALKYKTAGDLRGVGMWHSEAVDYARYPEDAAFMWGALPGRVPRVD